MNGSSKCLWPAFFSSPAAGCFFLRAYKSRPGGGHSLLIIQNLRFFSMQFNKMRGNKKMGVGKWGVSGLIRPPSVRVSPRWGCLASLLPGRLLSVGAAADKKRGSF
ncbi:hypothetical protein BLA28_31625 [Eisenbergiella tayi]|nr:hypothetical protein BLA28_31625 [Eisenbergiella tayi]